MIDLSLLIIYINYIPKKVLFNLHSDLHETGIRILNEENRESVLKKSSVDTFIMAVKK